ncbi:MAG: ABC transporter permease, partial [Bauldia litoralis]
VGALAGGGVALAFHGATGWYILPLMVAAAFAGGAAWAAIPAFLRTRFHANEILNSLMLTYVAAQLLGFLVHGPWRSPDTFHFPVSRDFGDDARLPYLTDTTELHLGVLFAVIAVPLMWVLTQRSYAGFQVQVAGLAPRAADYAGFKSSRIVWIGMLSGGALAGLAGLGEVAGPIGKLQDQISPGYGFAAIIVAFLGRLHPVGIFFASLLMALLYLGGGTAQIEMQIPPAVTGVFQGMLLFFLLGADLFVGYRIRRVGRVAA